jgi:hypothetical protein
MAKKNVRTKIKGAGGDDWGLANRARDEQGQQVKCLNTNPGWRWMRSYFDRLPAVVRQRLSDSRFNICAACMTIEAMRIASERGVRLSVKIYIETIEAIEKEMESSSEK